MINRARKPVLYLGGGVIHADAAALATTVGGEGRVADDDDVDGAGRDAVGSSVVAGHARHACGAVHEHGSGGMRFVDRSGREV